MMVNFQLFNVHSQFRSVRDSFNSLISISLGDSIYPTFDLFYNQSIGLIVTFLQIVIFHMSFLEIFIAILTIGF